MNDPEPAAEQHNCGSTSLSMSPAQVLLWSCGPCAYVSQGTFPRTHEATASSPISAVRAPRATLPQRTVMRKGPLSSHIHQEGGWETSPVLSEEVLSGGWE